tara:strand:- start:1234 stop:2109 length:876 start_codon:yes stop_codon:yes gene_type:complete
MVTKKENSNKISKAVKKAINKNTPKKISAKNIPTLQLKTERDIASDFAGKAYRKFDALVKSVVLFGSQTKQTSTSGSDIDIIIIIDDTAVQFDDKLVTWYREELGKLIQSNPYKHDLHINTVKLTTWWEDLSKGDPTLINIIRYGEALIDYAGFFEPMKILLQQGRIKPTPEAIYTMLDRIPKHIVRSQMAEVSAIEGCYWAMVESAQTLLMAIKVIPPSPEHIAILLKEHFVDKKLLKMKYVLAYRDLYDLHRKIVHEQVKNISGSEIDNWQETAKDFFKQTIKLIDQIL